MGPAVGALEFDGAAGSPGAFKHVLGTWHVLLLYIENMYYRLITGN